MLEGADPDPSKALEAIARGRKAFRSGIVIPWNALEARAKRLADPAWRPSPAEALSALERALALEPDAARMLLLKAETEIRLGRRDAARRTLADFWATASPEMYRYEWMLLCWLAGDPVPLSAALGEFATRPVHTWGMHIRLAHAVLFGDPREARTLDLADAFHRDEYDYWIARAWLEGADPDPSKALEAIARGRKVLSVVVFPDALGPVIIIFLFKLQLFLIIQSV